MKRTFIHAFVVLATALCVVWMFTACVGRDKPTEETVRKNVERIGLSGMRTEFIVGDAFDTGNLTVTVSYSDGTTEVVSSDVYTVDSSAYSKDVAGVYTIAVKLIDTAISESYKVNVKKADVPVHDWTDDGALKILMIGNSFSDDTIEYAWSIARNIGIQNVFIAGLYIGSCTLDMHADNARNNRAAYAYRTNSNGKMISVDNYTMRDAIRTVDWDFISLQQASGSSGMPDTYDALSYLTDYVHENMRASCYAKIVWNMTWAYQQNSTHGEFHKYNGSQATMYGAIVDTVQTKVEANDSIEKIIPCGTAIQNARTSYVGDTLTRDGYHMSLGLGRYIAGLTLIHALTGLPIDEVDFVPTGMDEIDLPMAVDAVKKAVRNPYEVTESAYKTDPPAPTVDPTKYTALAFELEQGFYNSVDSKNPVNIIKDNSDFNRLFLATKRFTPTEIPVGSIIILEPGWQYRPERWTDDAVQTTRENNTTARKVTVTPAWWSGYTYRAFNISKVGAAEPIHDKIDMAKSVFRIYIPKEKT